jgi:hypothetical protein
MSASDMRVLENEPRPGYRFRLRSLSHGGQAAHPGWPEADKKP